VNDLERKLMSVEGPDLKIVLSRSKLDDPDFKPYFERFAELMGTIYA